MLAGVFVLGVLHIVNLFVFVLLPVTIFSLLVSDGLFLLCYAHYSLFFCFLRAVISVAILLCF